MKIEWTVIYCTWFWHVFTVRSWKMWFLISVWCWILNGIQSGEWKWSFVFLGGVVVSETDRLSNWWLQEKSRCFHCIRGKKVFWWRYLHSTCVLWEFIFMPKRCQEPCKRDTYAHIYIYICIFAHYISVEHGVFFDLQPLPSWPSFAVGTNCNCWNEDPHIRQLDCHILESDGIIQATPPEISHGYLE